MLQDKITFDSRDLGREPLTEAELDELIGDRDHRLFLNPRNELFRKRKMSQNPPSRAEAIRLMAKEPNLIRRPLLVRGTDIVFGFDVEAYRKLR